ncbi:MAG: leucine-rich repeat protein [Lachnospiraceae bacterium]
MRKKLIKGVTLMVAILLSVNMTVTPAVQAFTVEESQTPINSLDESICVEENTLFASEQDNGTGEKESIETVMEQAEEQSSEDDTSKLEESTEESTKDNLNKEESTKDNLNETEQVEENLIGSEFELEQIEEEPIKEEPIKIELEQEKQEEIGLESVEEVTKLEQEEKKAAMEHELESAREKMKEMAEQFDTIQAVATKGTCGKNLTWHIENGNILYIDGTGKMDDFLLSPWYQHEETIENVYLSDGITSIGEEAFVYCTNLKQISIPETVTSIGKWAFAYCYNLKSITLPKNITKIEDNVFYNCSRLTTVNIPEAVTSIGKFAFDSCSKLSQIILQKNVTSIGESAFYDCSSLNEISIPKSVTNIGMWAFAYCSNLSKITILNKNCQIYSVPDTISDTAIIYGYSNSTAQKYAKNYSKRFKALDVKSTTYKITYDANGGKDAPATQIKEKDIALTLNKAKPTRKGYTFLGWATSKTSTKVAYAPGATFRENKNCTLYALWKTNIYKIAFDKNGGTGSMATMSCNYNKSYALKANTFTKKGYIFQCWNAKPDGTGNNYADKVTIKNLSSINGKTVTLYAKWEPIKYTITYQLNGGTNNKSNPSSYNIATSTITLKKPTRKGYTFDGWYTSSNYKTKVTKISKGSMGNKIFYAKWKVNTYKIVFDKNGGTGSMATMSCNYNKSYALKANTFSKKGYTFKCWNAKADGTGNNYADKVTIKNLSSINGKTVTLYAQWEPETT